MQFLKLNCFILYYIFCHRIFYFLIGNYLGSFLNLRLFINTIFLIFSNKLKILVVMLCMRRNNNIVKKHKSFFFLLFKLIFLLITKTFYT